MRPPPSSRKIRWWIAAVLLVAVAIFGWRYFRPRLYRLDLPGTTYSGIAGLRVDYVPGLGGRGECPEAADAGCIVGYTSLGDDAPPKDKQLHVSITCYRDGKV